MGLFYVVPIETSTLELPPKWREKCGLTVSKFCLTSATRLHLSSSKWQYILLREAWGLSNSLKPFSKKTGKPISTRETLLPDPSSRWKSLSMSPMTLMLSFHSMLKNCNYKKNGESFKGIRKL
jgi:hypothetical protein